ncbi:hypothetical protein L484_016281 [Morus notabilis]|uniref:Uncharacterized protein n=1 Tax=Morus notabilis TaxID=981085 RepID=W9RH80_9ROSA|nr:hypothetical protein L484_016281 [Morus notabilis]
MPKEPSSHRHFNPELLLALGLTGTFLALGLSSSSHLSLVSHPELPIRKIAALPPSTSPRNTTIVAEVPTSRFRIVVKPGSQSLTCF